MVIFIFIFFNFFYFYSQISSVYCWLLWCWHHSSQQSTAESLHVANIYNFQKSILIEMYFCFFSCKATLWPTPVCMYVNYQFCQKIHIFTWKHFEDAQYLHNICTLFAQYLYNICTIFAQKYFQKNFLKFRSSSPAIFLACMFSLTVLKVDDKSFLTISVFIEKNPKFSFF